MSAHLGVHAAARRERGADSVQLSIDNGVAEFSDTLLFQESVNVGS